MGGHVQGCAPTQKDLGPTQKDDGPTQMDDGETQTDDASDTQPDTECDTESEGNNNPRVLEPQASGLRLAERTSSLASNSLPGWLENLLFEEEPHVRRSVPKVASICRQSSFCSRFEAVLFEEEFDGFATARSKGFSE